ncbi:MAG: DNA polymerase I [Clostridiales bacterium]|nr:DNA polymerase I [Clostridiales bacterium]
MRLLVIDGNSIINRAFYGIKLLTTKDGRYTNGVYGFLSIYLKLLEEVKPQAVAVAFDVKGPTFRHEMYEEYKAKRKGMPQELAEQMPILKELLTALGVPHVESAGWEADDILGTLAGACGDGDECVIATGDRDSLQLVDENVKVLLASTKMGRPHTIRYDLEKIKEEYKVSPEQLLDIKALMGDSSDNIPGVAGVGQKTATQLIERFGSLDNIYENLESEEIRDSLRARLEKGRDSAYLSKELGRISTEVPIETDFESYLLKKPDVYNVTRIMADLEMFKLLERLNLDQDASTQARPQAEKEDARKVTYFKQEDPLALLEELKKLGKAYFLCVYSDNNITDMYFSSKDRVTHIAALDPGFFEFFAAFAENEKIKKFTYDLKSLHAFCLRNSIELKSLEADCMISAYILNPNSSSYDIERLSQEYDLAPLVFDGDEKALEAARLPELLDVLKDEIAKNEQEELIKEIEIPLAAVLASMEYEGFLVDKHGLIKYGETIQERINAIEGQVYEYTGYEFNLNSPKQLSQALFEKLGLRPGKKTKSGYSTGAQVLESLVGDHPVIDLVLEYRMLAKLKSTYCDGMVKVVDDDGRIHSTFKQTETRTGRLSSTEPNMQNIPVRSEPGRELRRFFSAGEGNVLVDADYSQIELRLLAHFSGDEAMTEAFNQGLDIHAITASQVFGMPIEMVTPLMRTSAKAVNFGIVYGIGAFSLAKDIGVTRKEADEYIKGYLAHYGGVADYMENVVQEAKEKGYVQTLYKRRRYLPELTAPNANLRAFGERVALNMPIQGTAADIIKIAMVKVHRRLAEENFKAKLIMQVHDELIVEAPKEEAQLVSQILKEEMENAAKLNVGLVADVHIGKTWYDAKG